MALADICIRSRSFPIIQILQKRLSRLKKIQISSRLDDLRQFWVMSVPGTNEVCALETWCIAPKAIEVVSQANLDRDSGVASLLGE